MVHLNFSDLTERLGETIVEVRMRFQGNSLPNYDGSLGTMTYDGALAALLELRVGDTASKEVLRYHFDSRLGRNSCSFAEFLRLYASATGLDGPEGAGFEGGLWIEQPPTSINTSASWAPLKKSDVGALRKVFKQCAGLSSSLSTAKLQNSLALAELRDNPNTNFSASRTLELEGYLATRVVAGVIASQTCPSLSFEEFCRAYVHLGGKLPVPSGIEDNILGSGTGSSLPSSSLKSSDISQEHRNGSSKPDGCNKHKREEERLRNSSAYQMPREPVAPYFDNPKLATLYKEFRSEYDLSGEGRVTFLMLMAAIESGQGGGPSLREARRRGLSRTMLEALVRQWLDARDTVAKGFVTFEDFIRYRKSVEGQQNKVGDHSGAMLSSLLSNSKKSTAAEGRVEICSNTNSGAMNKLEDYTAAERKGEKLLSQRQTHGNMKFAQTSSVVEKERRENAVMKAFRRLDLNGDGVVTYLELRESFNRQHRKVSEFELREWIKQRDSTGRGGVTFEDFRAAYLT